MKRLQGLLNLIETEKLDGIFISSVSNITYLTGFTGDSSRLLISKKRIVLITDGRYTEQAQKECSKEVEVFQWVENKRYATETYFLLIEDLKVENLGFESSVLTYSEYQVLYQSSKNIQLIPVLGLVEKLRQQKDIQEVEFLRTACEISDRALELTLPFIKKGITELELAAQLEYQLKMNGAENLSFDSLILSGSRTSLLHGKPSTKKLENGDLILFDFGALYKGFHADISRTFILGNASSQQKEVYSIMEKAQKEAVRSLKAGISSKIPDNIVRDIIPEKYLPFYYPGLGHGVGLEIHEQPFLGHAFESQLYVNMVITIEPGIYIPNWGGIRIEDTVWIHLHGQESLSKFPRELQIL